MIIRDFDKLEIKGKFVEYLQSRYDARDSFYKKARIYELDGIIYLVSYATIVAYICADHLHINGWYSQTTARHINEFARQNNFDTFTKKEMEEIAEKQIYKARIY